MEVNSCESFTEKFRRFDKRAIAVSKGISYISPAFLLCIMFIAVADVISTRFFHASVPHQYQIIQYFAVCTVYLSVAWVQMSRGHTKMGMFLAKMPKIPKMITLIISNSLGATVATMYATRAIALAAEYIRLNETSLDNGGFPLWPFVVVFAFGYFCLTAAFIICIFRAIFYRNDVQDNRSDAQKEADEARVEADKELQKMEAIEAHPEENELQKGGNPL